MNEDKKDSIIKKMQQCFICENKELRLVLSLGHQPPSNAFIKKEGLNVPEITYPLDVFFCGECFLVQLGYCVNKAEMFSDYVYTTGSNSSLIANFSQLVKMLIERYSLSKRDLAIDIGSNDGTLLSFYKPKGVKILGIEPSSIAKMAVESGVPTMKAFFNEDTVEEIVQGHGKAKIITATNVFAHVENLHSMVKGISQLLTPDGVFVSESHHLLSLIRDNQWDSIYHEHLRYYSLKPLMYLFNLFGLEVFDAELIGTHGGSLRVFAAKIGAYEISSNAMRIVAEEEKLGLYSFDALQKFKEKVVMHKLMIQQMLIDIKKDGGRIMGIGAPAKGNTLLNYCNLTPDILDAIVERSPLKIGLYTPGTHIRVEDESLLFTEQPEYGLLLSWNIANDIIPKLKEKGFNGKIIIPIPELHCV